MSGSSSNLSLNATNQQNIVLNQQNLINRGNIIVNQTQNTQNLILNQTNIMQNSQNIILNHPSSQNIVLSQNNLISRPSNVQSQKQSPIHPSPCQSPYQIFNTNATMVGSNNLSLISNFPTGSGNFGSSFQHQSNVLQTSNVTNACLQTKNVSPSLNIVSNVSANIQSNISSNLVSNQSISTQIGTKINQNMTLTSNNLSGATNTPSNFSSNYSNPSPISNPINSPYSNQILSPSNSVSSVSNLKSPVQSPSPILRPTTPQPIIQQTFQQIPVMTSGPNQLVQIIQTPNNGSPYQNQILGRQQIIAPTTHIQTNSTSIMKIKQPLNILPKPPTAVNSSGGAKSNRNNHTQAVQQQNNAPQIVLPNQAILPQAQTGTLVLNQMPLLVQQNTPQGIQLVLRPGTPNNPQISNQRTTQNLILQQNNSSQPTVLIQHNSRPTIQQQPQQLVRVLTANGLVQQLATATPTFIAMNGQPLNLQQLSQQKATGPHIITNQTQQNINIQTQNMSALSACIPNLNQITQQLVQSQQQQISVNNNNVTNVIQQNQQHITAVNTLNVSQPTHNSNIVNNALSTNATQIINAVATNTTNVANAIQANISVLPTGNNTSNHLSNVTIHTSNETNAISSSINTPVGQGNIGTSEENTLPPPKKKPKKKKKNKETKLDLANLMKLSGIGDDDDVYLDSDADMSNTSNNPSTTSSTVSDQKPYQNQSVSPAPKTPSPCIITTPKQSPQTTQIIDHSQSNQQITLSQNMIQKLQSISQEYSLSQNDLTSLMSFPSQIGSIQISAISDNNINNKTMQKPQIIVQNNNPNTAMLQQQQITQQQNFNNSRNPNNSANQMQNLNIPTQIGNIQISQICSPSNSSSNTALQNNTVVNSNVLQHNQGGIIVQQNVQNVHSAQTTGGGTPHAPLGGFKLTMTEDGRILLQHDPTMHQDLQSQMLLQQIFGLNIVQPTVQPNIVFTSNPGVSLPSNIATQSQLSSINTQQQKPIDNLQQNKFNNSTIIAGNTTKTINSIQQTVATPKIESNNQLMFNEPLVLAPSNINGQIMLSLSADQLEQLKNNPQFSINGPTLVLNNAGNITQQTMNQKPPMSQNINVNNVVNKTPSNVLVQHMNSKSPLKTANENIYPNTTKQNVISPPKSVGKVVKKVTKNTTTMANNLRNVKTVKSLPEPVKVTTTTTSSSNIHLTQSNLVTSQLGQSVQNVVMSNSSSQTNCSPVGSSTTTPTQSLVTTTNVSPICSITQNNANNLQNVSIQNSMPPLIAVSVPKSIETPAQTGPTMTMPGLNMPQLVPLPNSNLQVSSPNTSAPQMYQRVQTIQLTPQKQQQLKNIQLQIQALSARLQNKSLSENIHKSGDHKNENSNIMTDSEIQSALQRLFNEQQKILATGKLLSILPGQPMPNFSNANVITSDGIQLTTGNAIPKSTSIQFSPNFVHQSSPTVKTSCQTVQASQNPPKVYYHHMGNQVMQINQNACNQMSSNAQTSTPNPVTIASGTATVSNSTNTEKTISATSNVGTFISPNKITPIAIQTQMPEKSTQISLPADQPPKFVSPTPSSISPPSNNLTPTPIQKPNLISPNTRIVKRSPLPAVVRPAIPRGALIEHQLSTDQTEAANPDIHTPFASKADACKRLVRYHCFNQPVLSQKDLNKADEIFEMTARHFIDKFYNMVNKYKSLRLLESMREVPTSELMMIDRMFIAGEQQELDKLRAEKLQWDLEGNGCDISIANLIKHENIMAQHSHINMQTPHASDYKMHSKTDIFDVKQADLMKHEIDSKIKSEASENTEYDEWLCIQKELGYVTEKTASGVSVKTTMSPPPTTSSLGVSKKEIKVEDDFDIETNIKTFEIRSQDTKRTLPDLSDHFSESAKRICTNESRNEKVLKASDINEVDMTPIKDPLNDLNDKGLANMDLLNQGFTHGVDSVAPNKAIEVRATFAAMETSTNYKPVNSESEVFRTQNSYKKTFVSVSNNLTSHSISNSVSQPKLGIGGGGSSTNIVSQTDIDLELEQLGIDQFSLLKSNNLDSLDIDAQVQSAIDSILNLQQTQDGSINMNTILSNANSQHCGNADDVDKSAQFINDLLGVSSTVSTSNSIRKGDCAKRRVDNKTDQLYDDLTSADKSIYKMVAKTDMDSFSECSSPDDALDQAVRSILS